MNFLTEWYSHINFINDWYSQGGDYGGIYHFTLLRIWAGSWSVGFECCNFGMEWER